MLPITSSFGDENVVAGKQLAHQRHKSLGIVKNGINAPGMNAAAKRTVFGDVSNTAHALIDTAPKDLGKARISTLAPREKPTNSNKEKSRQGGEAFTRPPLRSFAPSTASLQASNIASGPKPPAHLELPRGDLLVKPAAPKKATFIFSDEDKNGVKAKFDAALKADDSASAMENQVKNPRHFKSQPQLRTEQQPVLRRTQSRHFGGNSGVLINVDEDVTEAPYHDAMENLSSLSTLIQDQLQVKPAAPTNQDTGVDQQDNPQPDIQLMAEYDAAAYRVDQDAMTEPDDNWDEDDGDLYDEQGYTTAHSFKSHGDNTTGGVTTMLAPKFTAKVQKELEIAAAIVESTTTEEQIEEEEWDTSMVAEYGEEIFSYMRKLEVGFVVC